MKPVLPNQSPDTDPLDGLDDPARRQLIGAAGAAAVATALPTVSSAQGAWPNKAIKIVVGSTAAGLTDLYARQYGEYIGQKLGQPVVIENKPGASGTIGSDLVAKAAPDGYTFLVTISTSLWHARVLYRKLPFDADKDLAPIAFFPAGALALAVNASLPIRNVKEYVDYAKKSPTTMGTYAPASWPHMIADTWNRNYGLSIQPVHYKGEAPMWVDVSTGQVTGGIGSFQALKGYIDRGAIRPIAVVGSSRSPRLPDVPTFGEQGLKDPIFVLNGWIPMCAPAGTPEPILQRMSDLIQEAFHSPKIKAMHESFGIPDRPTTLAESRKRWKDDAPEWIATADKLGIKLD